MTQDPNTQNLQTVYDELCTSYRAIDDFRAKMLALLPTVSAGGVFLLTGRDEQMSDDVFVPAGLFGIAITIGLLTYELFGIAKCTALIIGGKVLETQLNTPPGQFLKRPELFVNEPFAAAIIYPAVLAGWVYVALFTVDLWIEATASIVALLGGCALVLWYTTRQKHQAMADLANALMGLSSTRAAAPGPSSLQRPPTG